MVLAWYMDDNTAVDQRQPHKKEPWEEVSVEQLKRLGVDYWWFNPEPDYEQNPDFQQLKLSRGYSYQDLITVSPQLLRDYENKLKSFYEEHIHLDEEIRYVLEGSGYFDVRDMEDRWIRIHVELGDMIVLPAGIYHRFTLDCNNYIKALRLFVGEPVWTPYSRSEADEQHPSVIGYRQKLTCT